MNRRSDLARDLAVKGPAAAVERNVWHNEVTAAVRSGSVHWLFSFYMNCRMMAFQG
jgi:hypothetical protein